MAWGLALQFILGLLVLRWETGRNILSCLADKVTTFLDYTKDGSVFVYSYLANNTASPLAGNQIVDSGVFAFEVSRVAVQVLAESRRH